MSKVSATSKPTINKCFSLKVSVRSISLSKGAWVYRIDLENNINCFEFSFKQLKTIGIFSDNTRIYIVNVKIFHV